MKRTPSSRPGRQAAILYGVTLVVTVGLTLMQSSVGWLRGYLLVMVAATFLYLPIEVLHRTGEDPEDFGIHRRRPWRSLRVALLVMLVTFPPYLLGFHVWQTQWLGREFAPAEARFDRWPIELDDVPRLEKQRLGEVRLFEANERLWLSWHLPAGQRFSASLVTTPAPTVTAGGHLARSAADGVSIEGGSDGRVALDLPGDAFVLDVQAGGDQLPADRLRLGTALVSADDMPYRAERGYWWLLNLILVQLLLVALPEEVFYRGYLQTRLDRLIGRDRDILGVPVNVKSVLLTSTLFAIGHIATIPAPQRLAVFFPSLLFGWMRRASGGVMAPLIYHAACNLLVDVAARFYV